MASYHFAPTPWSKENLLKENINEEGIIITGNTVIDAVQFALNKIEKTAESKEENIIILRGQIPNIETELSNKNYF